MYTPVSAGPFTPTQQQQAAGYAGPAAGSYIGTSTPSANLPSGYILCCIHVELLHIASEWFLNNT